MNYHIAFKLYEDSLTKLQNSLTHSQKLDMYNESDDDDDEDVRRDILNNNVRLDFGHAPIEVLYRKMFKLQFLLH